MLNILQLSLVSSLFTDICGLVVVMVSSSRVCLLLAAAPAAIAQFVTPPTDFINATGYLGIPVRYKDVPTGICELDPNVKSYSGYVDVADNQQ